MEKIKKYIEAEILKIKSELSNKGTNKTELIKEKEEFDDFLFLIELYYKLNLKKKNIIDTFALPYLESGFSEYRIIDDCETEDRKYWKEIDNTKRLFPRDVIIKLK